MLGFHPTCWRSRALRRHEADSTWLLFGEGQSVFSFFSLSHPSFSFPPPLLTFLSFWFSDHSIALGRIILTVPSTYLGERIASIGFLTLVMSFLTVLWRVADLAADTAAIVLTGVCLGPSEFICAGFEREKSSNLTRPSSSLLRLTLFLSHAQHHLSHHLSSASFPQILCRRNPHRFVSASSLSRPVARSDRFLLLLDLKQVSDSSAQPSDRSSSDSQLRKRVSRCFL